MKKANILIILLFSALILSGCSGIHRAVRSQNLYKVREAIKSGENINEKARRTGDTPLIAAAYYGNTAIMKFLIVRGADLNLQNRKGFTALHQAVYYGHFSASKLLVDRGIDVSIRDDKGLTALDYARQYNFQDIVSYLENVKKSSD